MENDFGTVLTFTRKLDTCDDEDMVITVGTGYCAIISTVYYTIVCTGYCAIVAIVGTGYCAIISTVYYTIACTGYCAIVGLATVLSLVLYTILSRVLVTVLSWLSLVLVTVLSWVLYTILSCVLATLLYFLYLQSYKYIWRIYANVSPWIIDHLHLILNLWVFIWFIPHVGKKVHFIQSSLKITYHFSILSTTFKCCNNMRIFC